MRKEDVRRHAPHALSGKGTAPPLEAPAAGRGRRLAPVVHMARGRSSDGSPPVVHVPVRCAGAPGLRDISADLVVG